MGRVRDEPGPGPRDHPLSVMLLGAGELSRELVAAFQRLGAVVTAVDRYADAPAHGVADRSFVVTTSDPDELIALIEREEPDFVVTEMPDRAGKPVVAMDALTTIAERGVADVVPTVRSGRLSLDREGMRRLAADELGLPTAPFWFAGSVEELKAVAKHAGYPLIVRPVSGRPGEGESVLVRAADIEPAWERAVSAGGRVANTRVLAETMVEFDYEVTLLAVRTAPGPANGRPAGEQGKPGADVQFCEPIGHRMLDGGVLESWQPQHLTSAARDAAKSISGRIVNALGGRGIYGVELLVRGDEVYFSDVSPRPSDSGLVTLRSQRLSQFELHARAILRLPVDTIMITPGAAHVVYAGSGTGSAAGVPDDERTERAILVLSGALKVPESDVRMFGHLQSYPRRRLGVALATAANVNIARDRARDTATAVRKFW